MNSAKQAVRDQNLRKQEQEKKLKSYIALKKNIDKEKDKIAGRQHERKIAAIRQKRAEDEEFDELFASGKNPYEVFRQREIDGDHNQKLKSILKRQEVGKVKTKKQLKYEYQVMQKEEEQRHREEGVKKEFQRQMGRSAKEERVENYMKKMTKGGVTRLNPGGATSKVYASKVMEVPEYEPRDNSEDFMKLVTQKLGAPKKQPTIKLVKEKIGDDEIRSRYEQIPLSKLEQKYLKQARERQTTNLVTKQICCGREFKGDAFLSNPSQIHFKDFVPNQQMKIVMEITNVSFTFNSFKLLPLDDEIVNYFDFKYKPPGRMSAGMSVKILIVFSPKINEDINSTIDLLSNTGKISIPLLCTTRKINPSLDKEEIDFGNIKLCENSSEYVLITNDGAGCCTFEVERQDNDKPLSEDGISLNEKGRIEPYSSFRLPINFAPKKDTGIDIPLVISFTPLVGPGGHTPPEVDPLFLSVKAKGVQPPIYCPEPVLDLDCCVHDSLYRGTVVLRNRGNSAFKYEISPPEELAKALEFTPPFGFVQAREPKSSEDGSFQILVKFRPDRRTLKKCRKFADFSDGSIKVEIPIQIPEQAMLVSFTFKAMLTSSTVRFEPRSLEFGNCPIGRKTTKTLKVTNQSALPLRFGFVGLLDQFSVDPDDGFGVLLPFETQTLHVSCRPSSEVQLNTSLNCHTTLGRQFTIPCRAKGIMPPILVEPSQLSFPVLSPGDQHVSSIKVQSVSKQRMSIHLAVSEKSGIKLHPATFILNPQKTQQIDVEFISPELTHPGYLKKLEDERLAKEAAEKAKLEANNEDSEEATTTDEKSSNNNNNNSNSDKNNKSKTKTAEKNSKNNKTEELENKEINSEEESKTIEEPQTAATVTFDNFGDSEEMDVNKHIFDNYVDYSLEDEPVGEFHHNIIWAHSLPAGSEEETCPIPVSVDTAIVPRVLRAMESQLDFGQMPVGQSKTLKVMIRNDGDTIADIRGPRLNVTSSFALVNAVRPIAPGTCLTMLVKYTAKSHARSQDVLRLIAPQGRVDVKLIGKGVEPSVVMDPEDGLVRMPAVMIGASCSVPIKLSNTSGFPLQFCYKPKCDPPLSNSGQQVFSVNPFKGIVEAGSDKEVRISFQDDCTSHHILEGEFHIGNSEDNEAPMSLPIVAVGDSFPRQIFASPLSNLTPSSRLEASRVSKSNKDPFGRQKLFPNQPGDEITRGQIVNAFSHALGTDPIHLHFTESAPPLPEATDSMSTAEALKEFGIQKTLAIGCAISIDDSKGGSFQITKITEDNMYNDVYQFDKMSGNLNASGGKEDLTYVNITFKPQLWQSKLFTPVSERVECRYSILLQGGNVYDASQPPEVTIDLLLTGFSFDKLPDS